MSRRPQVLHRSVPYLIEYRRHEGKWAAVVYLALECGAVYRPCIVAAGSWRMVRKHVNNHMPALRAAARFA